MLKDQIEGKNNSWAIRWYASAFLKNKLCLYPGKSYIQNIGTDGSGTHSGNSERWKTEINLGNKNLIYTLPNENLIAKKKISVAFISGNRKRHLLSIVTNKILSKLKTTLIK